MTFFVTWLCLALLVLSAEYSDAAVSCGSRLRIPLPLLFTHCNGSSPCAYGPWSEWSYTGVIKNDSRCNSGKVRQYKRAQIASTPACESHLSPKSETEYECEPTLNQKAILFIKTLHLGVDAERSAMVPSMKSPPSQASKNILSRSYRQCPTYGYCPSATQQPNNTVCRNIGCDSSTGKRSVNEESSFVSAIRIKENNLEKHIINIHEERRKRQYVNEVIDSSAMEALALSVPVKQFNMDKHLSQIAHSARVRRQACGQTRYVLFIVDTSGSIGSSVFESVKRVIADISQTLCDYLKVAMITYSSDINLEFCFNCNNNNRSDIKNAILRARYRGGSTHTTEVIKCACEEILTSRCGLPQSGIYTPNIDVVLLTDGPHNGPCRNYLDNELRCLHGKRNINTFGIGIGSVDHQSVVKLTKGNGDHIFRVDNFQKLQSLLELIKLLLDIKGPNGEPMYDCAGHDASCQG